MKSLFFATFASAIISTSTFGAGDGAPPAPRLPIPSERQLQWESLGLCEFVHFNMNTFTDKEWGYGDESPSLFNPTNFDADQIVSVAVQSGMRGLILTCKHHDGFCLWPSKYTERSVKNSPWRDGHGDVVKEISDACHRHGIKFGVYLSPWDRSRADYGTPEYITYYRNQLRELLTQYGPIFEIWFDGANGGDGFYGGAREKRTIDRRTYYDWSNTWAIVRELQPNACIFSDAGPDIRWVGNENGHAGDPCWETLNQSEFAPGEADENRLNHGDRNGVNWLPAECDVSIRPGWFYHASEDGSVKSGAQLLDLYFASVGRGAGFLLNVPPNRNGQISAADIQALTDFHKQLHLIFDINFARGAKAEASNFRGEQRRYAPSRTVDGQTATYWATDDGVTNAELTLTLAPGREVPTFDVVSLSEYLPLGQRIEAFALEQWKDGAWVEFAKGSSIGSQRLIRTEPIATRKVRLRILGCDKYSAISEVGLYADRDLRGAFDHQR